MNTSELTWAPRRHHEVEAVELDGELVLWLDGEVHRLNPTGVAVWRLLDGTRRLGDLVGALASEFSIDRDRVERDVVALCRQLADHGLLEGTEVSHPPRRRIISPGPETGPGPRPGPMSQDVTWGHSSGALRALDHAFGIRSTDAAIARYLERVLQALAVPGAATSWYSVVDLGARVPLRWGIYLDDLDLVSVADADTAVRHVLWHVNTEVVRLARRHLLVHAAGAMHDGAAIVLPGRINAGKTTMVSGLVLAGYQYLTDELVAFDLDTGEIDPYPRPLNIGRKGWSTLERLRPPDWHEDAEFPRHQWHVDVAALRPGAVAGRSSARFVVVPQFESGGPTRLEPISRAEALEVTYRQAMNPLVHGAAGFKAVARAVDACQCARLLTGSLDPAVTAVRGLVEGRTAQFA
jgi:hypothetical protein